MVSKCDPKVAPCKAWCTGAGLLIYPPYPLKAGYAVHSIGAVCLVGDTAY